MLLKANIKLKTLLNASKLQLVHWVANFTNSVMYQFIRSSNNGGVQTVKMGSCVIFVRAASAFCLVSSQKWYVLFSDLFVPLTSCFKLTSFSYIELSIRKTVYTYCHRVRCVWKQETAIADKPRDAFVQYVSGLRIKTCLSLHTCMLPRRSCSFYVSGRGHE